MLNSSKIRRFFVACDLEIWRMTLKNNRVPLLCYHKLCASFHSYQWIQTGVTARKRPIRVKIGDFLSRVTLKFDGWPWKIENNRAPLQCYFKLCASFHSHRWISTGVRKRQNWRFFVPCDLEIWRMTLKNNRVPLLSHTDLCASFHRHLWIQPGIHPQVL